MDTVLVYNPFAELVHYECHTRNSDVPRQDYFVSFRHYAQYLRYGDPYWNPNLSLWNKNIGFHGHHEQSALAFAEGMLRQLQTPAAGAKETALARALPEAKEEDLFVSWFDHTRADVQLSKAAMAAVEGYRQVRRMIWFIPPFENPFYGGIFTILRFADAWCRNEGVEPHFAICGSANCEEMLERIRRIHPQCTRASITLLANSSDVNDLPEADACVATFWATAYFVLKCGKAPRKFYFIQDYEPSFYRAGSASALAENTYRFGFYGIANTISLKEVYELEYGAKPHTSHLASIPQCSIRPQPLTCNGRGCSYSAMPARSTRVTPSSCSPPRCALSEPDLAIKCGSFVPAANGIPGITGFKTWWKIWHGRVISRRRNSTAPLTPGRC